MSSDMFFSMQCSDIFLHNRLNSRPVRGEALFLQLLNYIIELCSALSQKKELPFGSSLMHYILE